MQLSVYNADGEVASKVRVHDSVFKIEPNEDVIHRAVIAEMTHARRGTQSTKTRADVRGGGRKPWRQKGRGVARAGSSRSPLWRGGGVVFGPKPRNYRHALPKKMKRLARRSVLSQRAKEKSIYVVNTIRVGEPKTKDFLQILEKIGIHEKKVLFLPLGIDRNVILSARNLPNVRIVPAEQASVYDLLDCEVVLFEKEGIKKLANQLTAA